MVYDYLTEKDVKKIVKKQIYKDKQRSIITNLIKKPSEIILIQSDNNIIYHELSKHEKMVEDIFKKKLKNSDKEIQKIINSPSSNSIIAVLDNICNFIFFLIIIFLLFVFIVVLWNSMYYKLCLNC